MVTRSHRLRKGLTLPLDLWRQVDEEIDRRLQDLTSRGELARDEASRLRDKLLSPIHFGHDSTGSDDQTIEKALNAHDVPSREELERLHAELQELSAKLDGMIKQAEVKETPVIEQEAG